MISVLATNVRIGFGQFQTSGCCVVFGTACMVNHMVLPSFWGSSSQVMTRASAREPGVPFLNTEPSEVRMTRTRTTMIRTSTVQFSLCPRLLGSWCLHHGCRQASLQKARQTSCRQIPLHLVGAGLRCLSSPHSCVAAFGIIHQTLKTKSTAQCPGGSRLCSSRPGRTATGGGGGLGFRV